jgi:hypothetical protein
MFSKILQFGDRDTGQNGDDTMSDETIMVTSEDAATSNADVPTAIDQSVVTQGDASFLSACNIIVNNERRTVKIIIDNPLPDEDVIEITTTVEKAVALLYQAVTQNVSPLMVARFFDLPK